MCVCVCLAVYERPHQLVCVCVCVKEEDKKEKIHKIHKTNANALIQDERKTHTLMKPVQAYVRKR